MVVVHRALGCRFSIYQHGHLPAHVHVDGNGCSAKVQIDGPEGPSLIRQVGFGKVELRRVFEEVRREQARLLLEWERMHG